MLTVLTVWKSGGAFDKEYVLNLRRGVKQNLDMEHRFICLTDTVKRRRKDKNNEIQWEPLKYDFPKWYSKAEIFRPDLEKFGPFLFIDLSSVIVGDLTDLATYEGEVCVTRDFWYDGPSQSVLYFEPGSLRHVWDRFISQPEYWIAEGDKMEPPNFRDQILMSHLELPYWQDEMPGQVVSFKTHCANGIPENARIVKFHGKPRPHDFKEGWVKTIWKDGKARVDFIPKSNVSDDVSLRQTDQNSRRRIRWVEQVKEKHDKPIVIVGGGPSLKKSLGRIRLHALNGHEVWTLNGVHDYLIERGVIPDALVMLDSRPENVEFVRKPNPYVTYYIAARCHPDVFAALDGYEVRLWHPIIDQDRDMEIVRECAPFRLNSDKPVAQLVGGGSTVGLRAMYLAWWILGFTEFHIYGFDSSYEDGDGHAYQQALNGADNVIRITAHDKEFLTTSWMANQARGFVDQMGQMIPRGCEVFVYGDGLLPFLVEKGDPANEQSPSEVLERA